MPLPDRTVEAITRKIDYLNRRVETIREDATLSDLGKREQIRALHSETVKAVAELKGAAGASITTRRKSLENRLFGSPTNDPYALISMRDARDRVAQAGGLDGVTRLLEESHGDPFIARAAFARAVTGSRDLMGGAAWDRLVSAYLSEHPEEGESYAEFEQLSSPASRTADFAERMSTSVPTPAEVTDIGFASSEAPRTEMKFAESWAAGPAWRG